MERSHEYCAVWHIRYEKNGPVATLTMYRPERMNAMTNRMLLEAGRALAAAAEDRERRGDRHAGAVRGQGQSVAAGDHAHGQRRHADRKSVV